MASNECPHCGMPPGECYRICPSQDPYQGDQAREEEDYSFNARYDDIRERYASTAIDAAAFNDGDEPDPRDFAEEGPSEPIVHTYTTRAGAVITEDDIPF